MLKEQGFSLPIIKQVSELSGVRREEKYRHTYTNYDAREIPDIPLTTAQAKAYAPIHDAIIHRRFSSFLLHGVTGSGKTQVYIKAAAACVAENRIAVILVPEIMLTDQMVTRFVEAFGDEVVVFHSKLTISERYNNWERLRRKDSHIIIGARSAVFAPTDDIGLIVVDEEHDGSYKQEDMVRYHARQIALWRAESNSCPVILGSATPSIDSYYKAKKGIYTLLELPERIHHQPLPTVLLVDMKEELLHGNYSVFSDAMTDLIQRTLEKKEQMIMLLNRRGYSTFVMCRECGEPVNCPHCDVSLVYHRANEALRCHYCEYHAPVPEVCPKCGSRKIKFFGSGTQRVEEELAKRFPRARIARLDQDVAAKKGRGEDVLHGFAAGEYDILLGTQMVAKGHDFEGVTAVGILTADSVLNIPLYTAAERTFDLLTQAAGRAGRGKSEGHVVIQTYNPLHYAIIKSKAHDYKGFYKEEIEAREALGYPPCGEMIHFRMQHEKKDKAMQIATAIVEELSKVFDNDVEVLGPYEEGVNRVRNLYRISVMIRGDTLSDVKKYIYHSWIFTQDGLAIDVDPM
nr:primosomal protein N' [Veillonella magna]